MATKEIPPHVGRMKDELLEIRKKYDALRVFVAGPVFATLPIIDQSLLAAQATAMETYGSLLEIRIHRAGY